MRRLRVYTKSSYRPRIGYQCSYYASLPEIRLHGRWLEALGFCKEGESGAFVEGGTRIALEGELPMNTNGGQLSEGRMHGLGHLHEAMLQLRGLAGERQLNKPLNVSLVANGGGDVAGAVLLRRDI